MHTHISYCSSTESCHFVCQNENDCYNLFCSFTMFKFKIRLKLPCRGFDKMVKKQNKKEQKSYPVETKKAFKMCFLYCQYDCVCICVLHLMVRCHGEYAKKCCFNIFSKTSQHHKDMDLFILCDCM